MNTIRKLRITLAVTAALFLCGFIRAEATTRYVSPSGSGTTCSDNTPCSLTQGLSVTKAGDTLYLKAGTYATTLTNPIPSGLSSSQPTILAGKPGDTAILRPTTGSVIISLHHNRSNITFRNLTLNGSDLSTAAERSGFRTNSATVITNLVIEDLDIKNMFGPALVLGDAVNGCTIRRNKFRDNTGTTLPVSNSGIYHRARNCVVEHNEIYAIAEYPITIRSTMGGGTGNIYRYNVIRNSSTLIALDSGLVAVSIASPNNTFHHNLIYGNLGGGIRVSGGGVGSKFYNNTIYGNRGTGLSLNAGANNVEIKNNIVLDNGRGQIDDSRGEAVLTANLTSGTASNVFIDHPNGDFCLKSTATGAINKATSIAGFAFNGLARDIGACAYNAATVTSPPPTPTNLQPVPK